MASTWVTKGCRLGLLCVQRPPSVTLPYLSLGFQCTSSTSGARDCSECTLCGADSGLARLLGPTGHYAGPGATGVATIHRSVILLLSPQKTNADELGLATLATVGVAIPTLLVKTHHGILMITKTITIGNGSQGPGSWMLT